MNAELLYEALSDPQSLERLTGTDLEGLVQTYPYFSVGQLLLTKKRKGDPSTDSYQKQREYTQAFFRNPWWLFYQLELAAPSDLRQGQGTPPPTYPFESVAVEASTLTVVPVMAAPLVVPMMERPADQAAPEPETNMHVPEAAPEAAPSEPMPAQAIVAGDAGIPTFPVVAEALPLPEPAPPIQDATPPPPIDVTVPFMIEPVFPERAPEPIAAAIPPGEPAAEAPVLEPATVTPPEEAPARDPEELPLTDEDEPLIPLDIPSLKVLQPDPDGLTFEPLHMVDYFASQGIRLDPSELGNDKLGQHLMSFTEWLKKMKRIGPVERIHDDLDTTSETAIQHLAAVANKQKEAIVTESMALVWALQGKYNKAIEIYHKLSLQHPEKRAYFAAKIEQINRH